MARTSKKTTALTPEEKLMQALAPAEEQPYQVPENWCWIHLPETFDNQTDSKKKIQQKAYLEQGDIAIIDQGREIVGGYTDDQDMIFTGKLPVIIFGDHTRCIKYIDFPFAQGADGVKVLAPKGFFLPRAFYYAFQSIDIPNMGYRRHYPLLKNYYIPVPPLSEQQRIVDRLESLFAKLDEAKENAQVVVDGFENRKSAVLYKAVSGELTAGWRKSNGISKDDWISVRLSDVCKVNPPKADVKDLPDDLEVSFFPMSALSEIHGAITEPQTRQLGEVRTGFTNFSEGDVVFAKITPCMENGKSAIIGTLVNDIGFGTTEFFVLRCGEKLYNRFLWHLLRAQFFRDEAKSVMSGGVGQQRVPKSFLENYSLSLPPMPEQIAIVSFLDNVLEKELQAKETAEQIIDQIGAMKKSILARAFRGELGTNDPNDESAMELLKGILGIEGAPPERAKRISIPKELAAVLNTELEKKIVKLYFQKDTQSLAINDIMGVSSKKFDILESLRSMEQREIISKQENGNYKLVR